MRRAMTGVLTVGMTLSLAACGGGAKPEDTVKDFAQAAADKDYKKVCDMIDPNYLKEVESGGEKCEDSMKKASEEAGDEDLIGDPDKLEVGEAKVADDEKSATVPTTYEGKKSEVKLVKVDDEWKISFA